MFEDLKNEKSKEDLQEKIKELSEVIRESRDYINDRHVEIDVLKNFYHDAFNDSKSDCISNSNITASSTTSGIISWADQDYSHRVVACVQNITTRNYQINFSLHTGTGTNSSGYCRV